MKHSLINHFFYLFFFFLFSTTILNAQDGSLDEGFGVGGVIYSDYKQLSNRCFTTAFQSDKKIITGGYTDSSGRYISNPCIVNRFNTNYTLDSSFADEGTLRTNLGQGVFVTSDDRIFNYEIGSHILGCFKKDGQIDSSFGENGLAYIEVDIYSIVELDNGKFLVGGYSRRLSVIWKGYKSGILKLYSNGTVDTTFGINGLAENNFFGTANDPMEDVITQLIPLKNGEIIAVGCTGIHDTWEYYEYWTSGAVFISKYNKHGKLDLSYGEEDGFTSFRFSNYQECTKAHLLDNESVLLSINTWYIFDNPLGYQGPDPDNDISSLRLIQIDNKGIQDKNFGIDGTTQDPILGSTQWRSSCIDSKNRILCAAKLFPWPGEDDVWDSHIAILRFLPNGIIDSSFAINGVAIVEGSRPTFLYAPDESTIQINGYGPLPKAINIKGYYDYEFIRLHNNSLLPINITSFIASKKQTTSQLQWNTCSEVNTKGFSIERSANNKDYTSIGFVASKGVGNNCNNNYNFIDYAPFNGINYYRLQSVDTDGGFSYTDVQNLTFNISCAIKVSPNPASDFLRVEGMKNNKINILKILNNSGQILSLVHTSQGKYEINIASLNPGLYYLSIINDTDETQVLRFIKR